MNRYQRVINYISEVMRDVTELSLRDDYNLYYGYDYNENQLFRDCRIQLRQLIKTNKLSISDIKELRGTNYIKIMKPLCNDISKKYNEIWKK